MNMSRVQFLYFAILLCRHRAKYPQINLANKTKNKPISKAGETFANQQNADFAFISQPQIWGECSTLSLQMKIIVLKSKILTCLLKRLIKCLSEFYEE